MFLKSEIKQPQTLLLLEKRKKKRVEVLHLFWSMLPHKNAALVSFSFRVKAISDKQTSGVLFWGI